jgi:hypothetical protein
MERRRWWWRRVVLLCVNLNDGASRGASNHRGVVVYSLGRLLSRALSLSASLLPFCPSALLPFSPSPFSLLPFSLLPFCPSPLLPSPLPFVRFARSPAFSNGEVLPPYSRRRVESCVAVVGTGPRPAYSARRTPSVYFSHQHRIHAGILLSEEYLETAAGMGGHMQCDHNQGWLHYWAMGRWGDGGGSSSAKGATVRRTAYFDILAFLFARSRIGPA